MNKNLLLDILGESSALRNWVAQQLIVGLDYPMPLQTIEGLLAESPVFRNWALDQFDGEFLYLKVLSQNNAVQKVLDEVSSLLRQGNKIAAIKYLRDSSADYNIREGILKRYAYFTHIFEIKNPDSLVLYKGSDKNNTFSLHFSRNLVEEMFSTLA